MFAVPDGEVTNRCRMQVDQPFEGQLRLTVEHFARQSERLLFHSFEGTNMNAAWEESLNTEPFDSAALLVLFSLITAFKCIQEKLDS